MTRASGTRIGKPNKGEREGCRVIGKPHRGEREGCRVTGKGVTRAGRRAVMESGRRAVMERGRKDSREAGCYEISREQNLLKTSLDRATAQKRTVGARSERGRTRRGKKGARRFADIPKEHDAVFVYDERVYFFSISGCWARFFGHKKKNALPVVY